MAELGERPSSSSFGRSPMNASLPSPEARVKGQGDLDGLFAVPACRVAGLRGAGRGGHGRAVRAVPACACVPRTRAGRHGDVDDAEPDLGLGEAGPAVSRPVHSGSQTGQFSQHCPTLSLHPARGGGSVVFWGCGGGCFDGGEVELAVLPGSVRAGGTRTLGSQVRSFIGWNS
jgi:hypothetical protein